MEKSYKMQQKYLPNLSVQAQKFGFIGRPKSVLNLFVLETLLKSMNFNKIKSTKNVKYLSTLNRFWYNGVAGQIILQHSRIIV